MPQKLSLNDNESYISGAPKLNIQTESFVALTPKPVKDEDFMDKSSIFNREIIG